MRRDWLQQFLQQFLLMNILVQAQKYANEPATRCNSFIAAFIAAFILFHFTCGAGLNDSRNLSKTSMGLFQTHIPNTETRLSFSQ